MGLRGLFWSELWLLITIRHQSDPDRPVSASSNNLSKGLPSRLRPFGPQFNIIFAILLLFIVVTCHSHFDLYLLSLSSAGCAFNSSKISSFLLQSNSAYPAFHQTNTLSFDASCFYSFVWGSEGSSFSSLQKKLEDQCTLYFHSWTFLDQSWFDSVVYNSQYLRAFW